MSLAVRSQVNRGRALPARSRAAAPDRPAPFDRRGECPLGRRGRRAARRRPPPRAATRGSSRRPARRAPSPLAPAARSPRRTTRRRRRTPARRGRRDRPCRGSSASAGRDAARVRELAQALLVRRAVAGHNDRRGVLHQAERLDHTVSVLVRALGRQGRARPGHRAGRAPRAARPAEWPARWRRHAERDDIDHARDRSSAGRAGRLAWTSASTMIRSDRRAAAARVRACRDRAARSGSRAPCGS